VNKSCRISPPSGDYFLWNMPDMNSPLANFARIADGGYLARYRPLAGGGLTQEIEGAEPAGAAPSLRGSAGAGLTLVPLCCAEVVGAEVVRLPVSVGR
jgi:hypothetical protein